MKNSFLSITIVYIVSIVFYLKSSAQEDLNITLRADYELSKKAFHNEPVIFIVSVSDKSAQSDILWNISADRRIRKIDDLVKAGKMKEGDAEKEKKEIHNNKRASHSVTIGSSASPWTGLLKWEAINMQTNQAVVFPVKLMVNPTATSTVVLNGSKSVTAYFGISPDDMLALAAGSYTVSVTMNGITDKIVFEIQGEAISEPSMSEMMCLKYGQFYWHAGDSKKTMQYAEMILRKNGVSVDGLSLKGDAQLMVGSYLPALETFNEAVKQYYKQNGSSAEPPEYLLSMISLAKEKLGDIKN